MKVCIVGAGAIGGFIGTRLAAMGGAQVSAIARGATLQALNTHGWRLRQADTLIQAPAIASDNGQELGKQDLVIVAVKGPALAAVAPQIAPLLGPDTIVLPAMNGVPWWFLPAALPDEAPLESVDPGGRLLARLPLDRVLGCVVHLACSTPEPGVVKHSFGERLIVGEPLGGASDRVGVVCDALADAGFKAEPSADIRRDTWYKLWGNMTMNPVSALTGETTDVILADALVRDFMLRGMAEAAAVGARIGCAIEQSGEERMKLARDLGVFRTSMLQDADAGRAIELDAIVGSVHEIGQRLGLDTPNIAALLGLTRLMARQRGLYPR
jgi:2-dehydropantoate 2-reductase